MRHSWESTEDRNRRVGRALLARWRQNEKLAFWELWSLTTLFQWIPKDEYTREEVDAVNWQALAVSKTTN